MRQLDTLLQRVQSEYALRLAAEERVQQLAAELRDAKAASQHAKPTSAQNQPQVPSKAVSTATAVSPSPYSARAATWSPPQGPQGGGHTAARHSHGHAAGQEFLRSTTYRTDSHPRSRSVSPRTGVAAGTSAARVPSGSEYSLEGVEGGSASSGGKVAQLREALAAMRVELAHAQSGQETAAAQLQDMTQQMQDGQLALAEKGAELRQLRAELVAARQAARSAASRTKEAARATEEAKAREASLRTRLEAVRAAMNKHEKAAAQNAKLSQRCSNAEEQVARLRSTVKRLHRQVDVAQQREKAMQAQAAMEGRAMHTVLARADALLEEQVNMQNTLRDLEQELDAARRADGNEEYPGQGGWDMQSAATRTPPPQQPHEAQPDRTATHEAPPSPSQQQRAGGVDAEALSASNAALAAALADSQAQQEAAEGRLKQLQGTVRVLRGRLAESHEHRQVLLQQLMDEQPKASASAPASASASDKGSSSPPRAPQQELSPAGRSQGSAHGAHSPLRFPATDGGDEEGTGSSSASGDLSPPVHAVRAAAASVEQADQQRRQQPQPLGAVAHAVGSAAEHVGPPPAVGGRQLSGYAADNEGLSSVSGASSGRDDNDEQTHRSVQQLRGVDNDTSGVSEPLPYLHGPPQPVRQSSPDGIRAGGQGGAAQLPLAASNGDGFGGAPQEWSWPPRLSASSTPRPWAPPLPAAATPAPGAAPGDNATKPKQRAEGNQDNAAGVSAAPRRAAGRGPTTEEEVQAGMALLRALLAEQEQSA